MALPSQSKALGFSHTWDIDSGNGAKVDEVRFPQTAFLSDGALQINWGPNLIPPFEGGVSNFSPPPFFFWPKNLPPEVGKDFFFPPGCTFPVIPEPSTAALCAVGVVVIALRRYRAG
jgi:hypothetical protein